MDAEDLLRRYNPVLVLLPRDPTRLRPWDRWWRRGRAERGDYHPCSAEFFLSNVIHRNNPRPWVAEFLGNTPPQPAMPLPELQQLVVRTDPDETRNWELDLATIKSQDAGEAWRAYAQMLKEHASLAGPAVYGRCVEYSGRIGLQYWYLYVYNDAPNKHEGDWEMVAFELDSNGTPIRAGYAGHANGFQREWRHVETHEGRPVVYVAHGSHAAYYEHKKDGHRTNSLSSPKGWPKPLEAIWYMFNRLFQGVVIFLRLHDSTPTHPARPGDEPLNKGELVCPDLEIMPELNDLASNPKFWWMRIRCNWGSRHSRLFGTAAPAPPWEKKGKWNNPIAWIRQTVKD